jgi:hypothetical protein
MITVKAEVKLKYIEQFDTTRGVMLVSRAVLTHEKLYVHDNPEISSQTFRYGD